MYGKGYGADPYRSGYGAGGGGGGYGGPGYGDRGYGGGYGNGQGGQGMFDMCAMCCGPNLIPTIAMILLIVVYALFIPGFAADYWASYETTADSITTDYNSGIWRSCVQVGSADRDCSDLTNSDNSDEDWLTATQALMCVTLICLVISTALMIYWLCSYSRYFFVKCIFILLLTIAFISSLVGVILFGVNATDTPEGSTLDIEFDWCFYLVDVATSMMLFIPILMVCVPSRETFPSYGGMGPQQDRYGFDYPRPPPAPRPLGPPPPRPTYGRPDPIASAYPSSIPRKPYPGGGYSSYPRY